MAQRGSKRDSDELRPAGEILSTLMTSLGLAGRLREREALERWPALVGEEIARRSEAVRIREGVLYVRVRSAAWSQELLFLKGKILSEYADALGTGLVKDIRFTQH